MWWKTHSVSVTLTKGYESVDPPHCSKVDHIISASCVVLFERECTKLHFVDLMNFPVKSGTNIYLKNECYIMGVSSGSLKRDNINRHIHTSKKQ